jgi:5-formyltetrahydrofolate cyclo-ligase
MTQNISLTQAQIAFPSHAKHSLRQYFKNVRKCAMNSHQNKSTIATMCIQELQKALDSGRIPLFSAIASYLPIQSEIPIHPQSLAQITKTEVYLPSTSHINNKENHLSWYRWENQPENHFARTAIGTLEPLHSKIFDFGERDNEYWLTLVPALAIADSKIQFGARLGYGGGFYDRFLENFKSRMFTIGVVFDDCVTSRLPYEAHDVSLDAILTERRFIFKP